MPPYEKYDCLYPRYSRDQLKPKFRQNPEGNVGTTNSVMVIAFNHAVLHSYQRPAVDTVGQIQQGLARCSNGELSNANIPAKVLALFDGIDYIAYSRVVARVCSEWHDPKQIIGDLEKELLLDNHGCEKQRMRANAETES